MAIKIEQVVKRVLTPFVSINNSLVSPQDFNKMVEAMVLIESGETERDSLARKIGYDWVEDWIERGILAEHSSSSVDYGQTTWYKMIKAGPNYKKFMSAVRAYEKTRQLEMAQAHREEKRRRLSKELADLNKPRRGVSKNAL